MSILYHRPKFIGVGSEVFVQINDEGAFMEACICGDNAEQTEDVTTL